MKCLKETINTDYYREKLIFNTTQKHSFSTFRSSVLAFKSEKKYTKQLNKSYNLSTQSYSLVFTVPGSSISHSAAFNF